MRSVDKIINHKIMGFILNKLESPILVLDPDYRIISLNEATLKLYEWQENSCLFKNYATLLNTYHFENPLVDNISKRHNNFQSFKVKNTIYIDNKKKIILWHIVFFTDEKRNKLIILLGNEITNLQKANEKIFELDTIIANMPGNVYWYDKSFKYLGCNENSAKTLNLSREDTVGKDFASLMQRIKDVDETTIKSFVADGKQVLRTKKPLLNIEEPPFVGPSGELTYYIANKVPLFTQEDEISGVLGISTDITAKKKVEALTISNLKKERKLLLKALQAHENDKVQLALRKNFTLETISGIAHELNQPLAAVSSYVGGIEKRLRSYYGDELPQDIQNALHYCKLQAKRAGDIIHSFKNLLDSGDISKKTCSINKLITSCGKLLADSLSEDGIILNCQLDKTLPPINCDDIQVTQIIYNLIINARDAILSSKTVNKTILITTNSHVDNNILISVQDFASGISPSIIDKIFLPFFTRKESGTGIGLSLAYTIAQKHGGNLSVKSVSGEGTTFDLVLPIQT